MWQKSNETDFLFTKVFIFFKHQCWPLQNSSLGQLHIDGDDVPTFGSSAGSLQPVWSSACPLHSLPSYFIKMSLEGSGKGSFASDQTFRTNGCSIMTMLHVTLRSLSQKFWPQKAFQWLPSPPIHLTSAPDFFLFSKLKNVLKGLNFGNLENILEYQKSSTSMLISMSVTPLPSFFLWRRPWKAQKKSHSREIKHLRQMDAPSWQCSMSHCSFRHRMFDFFVAKTRLLWFSRLLTLLIWLPATTGCSPNSRGRRSDIFLTDLVIKSNI